LGFCLLLLIWFFKNFKKVYNTSHAWPILMILLVSAHAMLELPLHYAYFLFPTCFLFGIVSSNHNELILNDISKGSLQVVSFGITICLLSAAILLSLLVRDYSRVESSYEALRFEIARIQYKVRGTPPDVIMLNQWRDFIELARAEPIDLATAESLDKAQGTVATLSSPSVIYKLASALALADQPIEAQIWLVRLCKTQPPSQCQAVKSSWINKARLNSKMESVDWTQISTPQ